MNSLANHLVSKSIPVIATVYQASNTGRPAGCVNEKGEPESSHSIGARYDCSYGKILWLFKKYDNDYVKVYENLKAKHK